MASVGTLRMSDLPALVDITSLAGLNTASELSFTTLDALTDLNGLKGLQSAGTLIVSENAALVDFTGLDALASVPVTFIVDRNPVLQRFTGLGSLTSVGALTIEENDALLTLEGLGSLAGADSITITLNDSLAALTGLTGLGSVAQALDISFNPALASVDALLPGGGGSLAQVGSLSIIANPALPTCAAIAVPDSLTADSVCIDQNLVDACDDKC